MPPSNNTMSLWFLILLIGFVFLITYNPRKGTLHTEFLVPTHKNFQKKEKDEDPLRPQPSNGMYDPVGAIFAP